MTLILSRKFNAILVSIHSAIEGINTVEKA